MTNNEKISLLEEVMDLEEGTLKADTILSDLDVWDSLTRLSIIIMLEENFGKELKGEQIRSFKTIDDILNIMIR